MWIPEETSATVEGKGWMSRVTSP